MVSRNTEKARLRRKILKLYGLDSSIRAVILDCISNTDIRLAMIEACSVLNIALISDIPDDLLEGCDMVVSDMPQLESDLLDMMHKGVAPIIPSYHAYGPDVSDFNPMKFIGNAFLFKDPHPILMLEQICRYLENIRYPGDRSTLLKNLKAVSR